MSSSLDLDALEREGRPEPLTITYRGEEFTLLDPVLMPWEEYSATDWDTPDAPVKSIMSDVDRERFMALKPSMRALEVLAERVTDYYTGLTRGESDGSSTS